MAAHTSSPAASSARYPRSTRTHKASTSLPQPPHPPQQQEEPQQQQRHAREPHQAHATVDATASLPAQPTPQWREHSDHHFVVRKQMIARLQRLHPLLATNSSMRHAGHLTRIPELVQRLELMLYKAANSLDEYLNVCTLERRVHSLVTMLEPLPPLAATTTSSQGEQLKTPSRKRRVNGSASMLQTSKRPRRSSPRCVAVENTITTPCSRLESDLNSDLLSHVFSFVDGIHTLRSCSLVSRFFHTEAPRLVTSLRIDVGDKTHAALLHGRTAKALASCLNLRSLTITNSRNNTTKRNAFARAFHGHNNNAENPEENSDAAPDMEATPASFMAATNPQLFTGRVFFYELSELFYNAETSVFPKLATLALVAPFDCANEAESTLAFLHAFASNQAQAPASKPLSLEKLVLDTTVLGDRRLPRLFALFHAFPRVFEQQLRVLDLSNNFVGEAGARMLCSSVSSKSWTKLHTLTLRRNILTDGDAQQLARVLESSTTTTHLQHVDVSENFIGKPGFEALARSANVRRVAVRSAQNCMDTNEAAQLFM